MKKGFLTIGFLTLLTLLAFKTDDEQMVWKHWNDGFSKAKTENKIALIDTYTEWCGWCKKMDRDTYAKQSIVKKINENFIPIKFNPELEGQYVVGDTTYDGRTLLAALSKGKSSGYPTTFFFLPNQNQMFQYPGYMDEAKFGELLDKLANMHNATPTEN
ncbi:MAG: hypothetical protein ACI9JN_001839 [Bacteroidia bacterium]|jgi:uncharacterized protein YyaL (SSP411 family)